MVGGQITTDKDDVFPFRPQWISRDEMVNTQNGHIIYGRLSSRAGLVPAVIPFTAAAKFRRSAFTPVHRVLVRRVMRGGRLYTVADLIGRR